MQPSRVGRGDAAAAAVYAVQAAALAVVLLVLGRTQAQPVSAALGDTDVTVGSVDIGWALVTVLAGGALVHALVVRAAEGHRRRMLVAGWSQGAAILVFLIAQRNGITELTALVTLYALSSTAVALTGLDLGPDTPTWRRPAAWAAVGGIVPWGVIAFAQLGAGVIGDPPTVGTRVVTLLTLAVAAAGWLLAWRRRDDAAAVAVMTAGVSLVAWTAALA